MTEVPPRPFVSVVVPTYRRPERCARLLRALSKQTLPPTDFEVLAVDDCSGDETPDVLKALVGEVPYKLVPLTSPKNGSPGRARNVGWRSSRAGIIAFIDDDCVPEPDWLAAGLRAFSTNSALGVVQGRTRPPDEFDESQLCMWSHHMDITAPTPFFETCNIFYRRDALEYIAGFDEEIGFWGDDTYAGWAVKRAGWTSGFTPDAVVVHDVELRSVKWFIRHGFDETNTVRLAAEFPQFRREAFWRSWGCRREDVAFIAAVASAVLALRWRPAAVGALPYLWWRRPGFQRDHFVRACFETVAVDASRSIGQLRGAVRHRIFVI